MSGERPARAATALDPRQLSLVASGEASIAYGYSFILTGRPAGPALVEHHHHRRAQIEERITNHRLGVSLRHLPASDPAANRTWLLAGQVALNLLAMLSDLASGPDPDERLPRRRQAKYLRRMLLGCRPR